MNNLRHPVTSAPQFLKVQIPVTTNGINLAYDANRQPIFRTKYLPLGAKSRLERKNTRLPEQLRLVISVVTNQPEPIQQAAATTENVEAPKNRGGRPRVKTSEDETK